MDDLDSGQLRQSVSPDRLDEEIYHLACRFERVAFET
jgi:hypothetical protein